MVSFFVIGNNYDIDKCQRYLSQLEKCCSNLKEQTVSCEGIISKPDK